VKFKLAWVGRKGKCPHCGAAMVATEFAVLGDEGDQAREVRPAPQKAPDEPMAEVEWEIDDEPQGDHGAAAATA